MDGWIRWHPRFKFSFKSIDRCLEIRQHLFLLGFRGLEGARGLMEFLIEASLHILVDFEEGSVVELLFLFFCFFGFWRLR